MRPRVGYHEVLRRSPDEGTNMGWASQGRPRWGASIAVTVLAALCLSGITAEPSFAAWGSLTRVTQEPQVEYTRGLYTPSISGDGRFVACYSVAEQQVYLYDQQTRSMRIASRAPNGVPSNARSQKPEISSDGRYVAFESRATNIVPGVDGQTLHVYVYDRILDSTELISTGGGVTSVGGSDATLNADGRFVAYSRYDGVFVVDRLNRVTTRVGYNEAGERLDGASRPSLSADGSRVAFCSSDGVFVRDLPSGTSTLIKGTGGNVDQFPRISGNGRFVSFSSWNTSLASPDLEGVWGGNNVFVWDSVTDETTLECVSSEGVPANYDSFETDLSDDGRYLVFTSRANNLTPGINQYGNVFLRDRHLGTTTLVSARPDGRDGNSASGGSVISRQGAHVAFVSGASDLVAGDMNQTHDVFVYDARAKDWAVAEIQHNEAGVTFDRFVSGRNAAYSGGGYVYGKWEGTRLQVRFTGSRIRWIGPVQPGYGMADVYVDGKKLATVDCYAPQSGKKITALVWESPELADGPHLLEIRLRGQKRPESSGYIVVIDRFEAAGTAPARAGSRHDESTGTFKGAWIYGANSAYIEGGYRYSRYATASFKKSFHGTRVAWIGPKTRFYGYARVYIDGVYRATVQQSTYPTGWRERVWESPVLPRGTHTIEIRPVSYDGVAPIRNIVIDALDVTP
jgi:Tol biopolymer transport system component